MPPDSRRLTLCAGRASPAPWLSHRESWHGAAVTERVPRRNQRTNVQTCDCKRPLRLAFRSPAPPEGEPRAAAPPNSHRLTLCAGRASPAPWLSLWESWHGVAVTERVLRCNLGTFLIFATAYALSVSRSLASSPKGGAKGGCAAKFPPTYPLRRAGIARPLALPMGELARRSRD